MTLFCLCACAGALDLVWKELVLLELILLTLHITGMARFTLLYFTSAIALGYMFSVTVYQIVYPW